MAGEDILAQALFMPVSAQKARLLVDVVRGKGVVDALNLLKFMPNQAARPLSKVIASAMANAEENFGVSRDDLVVYKIFADGVPAAGGGDLGRAGASSPGRGAPPTLRSSYARKNKFRDEIYSFPGYY